jgi:hypothetical protein
MNLLKETKQVVKKEGYKWPDDILSIQGLKRAISIGLFEKLADKEYDNGYGLQEVAEDLVILMKDGTWFYRGEYDGAEWWCYNKRPEALAVDDEGIVRVIADTRRSLWGTLEEMNKPAEEDEEDL